MPPLRAMRSICGERSAEGSTTLFADPGKHRVWGSFADFCAISEIEAAHARVCAKRHEDRAGGSFAIARADLLSERDDRTPLWCLIGERREIGDARRVFRIDTNRRDNLDGLAIAQRDRAGLVEQQGIDVAGRFDCPTAHRQNVALHHAVHTRDADCREQTADRRRDETDEQSN